MTRWAAAELAEIRRVWYPAASAGYRDWEPPRDPEARQERQVRRLEADDWEISRAGWCLIIMRAVHRRTLRRVYLDGRGVGGLARYAALVEFGRVWVTWSEDVDGTYGAQ